MPIRPTNINRPQSARCRSNAASLIISNNHFTGHSLAGEVRARGAPISILYSGHTPHDIAGVYSAFLVGFFSRVSQSNSRLDSRRMVFTTFVRTH